MFRVFSRGSSQDLREHSPDYGRKQRFVSLSFVFIDFSSSVQFYVNLTLLAYLCTKLYDFII